MGLLPQIADGVGVSIPKAGHVISAYALGVVVGAPVLAVLRRQAAAPGAAGRADGGVRRCATRSARWRRRYGAAGRAGSSTGCRTAPTSASPRWSPPAWSRPSAAGRAVAQRDARARRRQRASACRPRPGSASTLGWRSAYCAVAGLAAAHRRRWCWRSCRRLPGDREATGRRELRRCRNAAGLARRCWPARSASAACSRCTPTSRRPSTERRRPAPSRAVPVFLLAFGLGMVVGTWLAGRLADWSVFRIAARLGGRARPGAARLRLALAPYGWWPLTGALPGHGDRLGAGGRPADAADGRSPATPRRSAPRSTTPRSTSPTRSAPGSVASSIAAGYGYRSPLVVGAALSLAGFAVLALVGRRRPPEHDQRLSNT